MRKYFKTKKGFTLIELLIYMGLLSIFLAILTQLFVSALDIQLENEASSTIEQDTRHILTRLTYDIRRAESISTPVSLGETGDSLVLATNDGPITYSLTDNNLTLTDSSGTHTLNGYNTSIESALFLRIGNSGGNHAILVQMTLESNTIQSSGQETKQIQTTISTR